MEDKLNLKNSSNNIEIDIKGQTWEKILILAYKRNKSLFYFLMEVTEILEQKKFNLDRVKQDKVIINK